MPLTVYALKSCDTCKKAQKALTEAGVAYEMKDVRADGVPEAMLKGWLDSVGADLLVNKRSTTWRSLSDEEKSAADDPAALVALLAANPTLIKRPVITDGDAIHVGWGKDTQAALL